MKDKCVRLVIPVWLFLIFGIFGFMLMTPISFALEWNGYFSAFYQTADKEGENGSFDAFALSLIPKVELNEKLDIYAQIVFEHGGYFEFNNSCDTTGSCSPKINNRNSGELTLNDVYFTYSIDKWLKIRGGKFATPFGLWNTLQYAAPAHVTIRQPGRESIYSRSSSHDKNSNFFGRYSMGVWLLGELAPISYDLYVANGRTLLDDHKDDNESKAVGGRLGGSLPLGPSKLKLLYSYYQDSLRSKTTDQFADQSTHAPSLELSLANFGITSEFAHSKRGSTKQNGYYAIAHYTLLESWTPFVGYEYYEPNKDVDNDEFSIVMLGLDYHIIPWMAMVKLQADQVNNEDPDKEDFKQYWIGIAAAF